MIYFFFFCLETPQGEGGLGGLGGLGGFGGGWTKKSLPFLFERGRAAGSFKKKYPLAFALISLRFLLFTGAKKI